MSRILGFPPLSLPTLLLSPLLLLLLAPDALHGQKAPPPPKQMDLVRLSAKDAKCLDGSAAGYYYRKGKEQSARHFVVFLANSGWCLDEEECAAKVAAGEEWPKQMQDTGGPIDGEPLRNPDLAGWTHVLVPGCDYTSFLGNRTEAAALSGGLFKKKKAHFQGNMVLEGVLRHLVKHKGLGKEGGRVLLAGSGSGGLAVLAQVDRVAELLRGIVGGKGVTDVVGLVDAAFMPARVGGGGLWDKAGGLWNPVAPLGGCHRGDEGGSSTDAATTGKAPPCLSAHAIAPAVKSPLYVVQSSHDPKHRELAEKRGACPGGDCGDHPGWRSEVDAALRHVKEHKSHGLYLISCAHHEGLQTRGCLGGECASVGPWMDRYVQIGCQRINPQEAFGDWYHSFPWKTKAQVEYLKVEDTLDTPTNPSCIAGTPDPRSCAA